MATLPDSARSVAFRPFDDADRTRWWYRAGSQVVGKPHYHRIHGPTVLVEYDNSQTNANHSHTVWRDLEHDFGGDMLRAHYLKHQH